MKGCVIFFLDFQYNFPNIFNIISKSFAIYGYCHPCFLYYLSLPLPFKMKITWPRLQRSFLDSYRSISLVMQIYCNKHIDRKSSFFLSIFIWFLGKRTTFLAIMKLKFRNKYRLIALFWQSKMRFWYLSII